MVAIIVNKKVVNILYINYLHHQREQLLVSVSHGVLDNMCTNIHSKATLFLTKLFHNNAFVCINLPFQTSYNLKHDIPHKNYTVIYSSNLRQIRLGVAIKEMSSSIWDK